MGAAERIYELVQSLPEHRAAEVLDFAEHLKARCEMRDPRTDGLSET